MYNRRTIRRRGGEAFAAVVSCRCRRGQVLVIVLIAIALLVGLVFYVYNLGDQIDKRIVAQNAADATAIGGGVMMARQMNMVAMNNVAESRMIALVPALDAVRQASEMSFNEVDAWIGDGETPDGLTAVVAGLEAYGAINPTVKQNVLQGLNTLLTRLRRQRNILESMRGQDTVIERATTWAVPGVGGAPPHGTLWQAATALDQLSQATVASSGMLIQANAVRFGNYDHAQTAFVVPIAPQLPAVRGNFSDFDTVLRQRLRVSLISGTAGVQDGDGGAIPNAVWPYRLGPWANLFPYPRRWRRSTSSTTGWRIPVTVRTGETRTVDVGEREGRSVSGPSAGGGRSGRAANRGQSAREAGTYTYYLSEAIGYTTFGPYYWAKRWLTEYGNDWQLGLGDTRFTNYYTTLADAKLGYMFDGNGAETELQQMHTPQWIMSADEAAVYGENPNVQKTLTRYYYLEVISREPESSAGWANSITSDNLSNPVVMEFRDWVAPDDLRQRVFRGDPRVSDIQQVGSLDMWKFTATGTETLYNPDGSVRDSYPVYFVWYFIFGGLDVGGNTYITNPCNWDAYDTLPAPMNLNLALGDYTESPDTGMRRNYFTYLGIATKSDEAAVWPQRFTSANPMNAMVAVAQAKVFNNTSWDLWTQDWQTQLAPVTQWEDWQNRLRYGIDQTGISGNVVNSTDVESIYNYLSSINSAVADQMMKH